MSPLVAEIRMPSSSLYSHFRVSSVLGAHWEDGWLAGWMGGW